MNTPHEPAEAFVLTNHPAAFQKALEALGITGRYFSDLPSFIDAALEAENLLGLVLDVSAVMSAERGRRDHLFSLSSHTRILRARVDAATGHVFFIDEVSHFKRPLCHLATFYRVHPRVSLVLPVALAHEDDPAMAKARPARTRDISLGGCFIQTGYELPHSDFIYLQIPDLGNPLPVLCNIRWRKTTNLDQAVFSAGIRFMDIKPDQLDEIQVRFVNAAGR